VDADDQSPTTASPWPLPDGTVEPPPTFDDDRNQPLKHRRLDNPFVTDRVLLFDSAAAGLLSTRGRGPAGGWRAASDNRYARVAPAGLSPARVRFAGKLADVVRNPPPAVPQRPTPDRRPVPCGPAPVDGHTAATVTVNVRPVYDDVADNGRTGCCMTCTYCAVEMCGCSIM